MGENGDQRPSLLVAAGGRPGLERLATAWHARVLADDVVAHAFEHGFRSDHVERLAAYWAEALGETVAYSGRYGDESEVVRMHSGNGVHEEMNDRAIACFDQALVDVDLSPVAGPGRALSEYFAWSTRGPMSRYDHSADDVPDGLAVPRWDWNGRVSDV